jgi:hypothetical protein
MNFNTTETRLFAQFPELAEGLQLQEIARLERAISTADLNRLKKAIQLGELMQKVCTWYDLPETQTKFAEFGITWSRADIAQKVFLCSKAQMFKNIAAFKNNEQNADQLTAFNDQIKRLKREGQKVSKSLENYNKFVSNLEGAESAVSAANMLLPNVAEITPETIAQDNEPPAQSVINSNNAYRLEFTAYDLETTFTIDIMHDSTINASYNGPSQTPTNAAAIMLDYIGAATSIVRENRDNVNININE